MLFNRLPGDIFKPLAGKNKYLFEEILRSLYGFFSGEDLANDAIFPRKSVVKGQIEERLARKGRLLYLAPEDDFPETPTGSDPGVVADNIYRRLVQTGWLEEEPDGYNINVLIPPHATLLLDALETVAIGEKKNYGGAVASINLQLEAIANHPQEHARAFIEVFRATREFTRHLQNMLSGLRGFQEIIAKQRDPRMAMTTFFDDFVENLLISDYKTLHAEDNPFRHRGRVLNNLLYIEHSQPCMDALIKVYREDKGITSEKAHERVIHDLRVIRGVFESVDRRLSAIDAYRGRLESRVAEMVRYLDRSVPEMTDRGLKILEKMGARMVQGQTSETMVPGPSRWITISLVGTKSLRKRPKRRAPQYVDLPPPKPISEELRAFRRRTNAYIAKRLASPTKVAKYLEQQLGDRFSIEAKDLQVESIEDLVAFTFAPFMKQGKAGMEKFVVRRTGGILENAWMECPDFIVERKVG